MSHQRLESVLWLSCWILLYCPPTNALFCGSTRNLSADEGGYVVLQSSPSPSLSYITWDFIKHLIAITGPGRPLQPGVYSHKYSGRLSSLRDGSLMIVNLKAEDGQIYRADLFDRNGHYLCVQVYDLRTGERGGMSPSVDPLESCGPTQQLLYGLGGNIVFRLPSHSRVSYVQWDINNIDHIAITRPGGIMYRRNPNYYGKTSVMGDGSLKLSNLATKDQEVYRAEHFTDNWSHLCTQHYDVKVKSKSIMGLIRSVYSHLYLPWKSSMPARVDCRNYTMEKKPLPYTVGIIEGLPEIPEIYGLQTHIRLALSACILLATLSILLYHIKTECSRTPQWSQY